MSVPDALVSRVKAGSCILFLGSGANAPPLDSPDAYPAAQRPPVGGDLAERLADHFGFADAMPGETPRDLTRVAMYVEIEPRLGGRNGLLDRLDVLLRGVDGDRTQPSVALRMLAALPFKIIVTTNYDLLFDRALRESGKEPRVLAYNPEEGVRPPDYPDPTPEAPLLFKMHGDLNHRSSIVITDEDYITFVQRMADKDQAHPVPETVRYRMAQWPTLFVGYSLRDYNLRLLFRTLRWRLDVSEIPISFAIDRRPDPLILKVWQDQRSIVAFLTADLWAFAPELYRAVTGRDYGVSDR